jgi:hypothetical protein
VGILIPCYNNAGTIAETLDSFRENRDIGDSLPIVARDQDALSPGEWLRFHVRLLVFRLKRLGKSLLTSDFIRTKRCLHTAVTITIFAVQTR